MTAQPSAANWLSILALGLIWGGTFMVVSLALRGYGPVTVACARTTLGALSVLGLMAALGRPLPRRAPGLWAHVAAIGALSTALPFFLLSWGQQYVPSAFAGLSMSAIPLIVLPLAAVFADETLSWSKAGGVTLGFLGALVLIGPGLASLGESSRPLAQLACIGAAVSYAFSNVLTRRCPPIDPVTLTALTLTVGASILVPAMLVTEGVPRWEGAGPGWAILFLGLVPTAGAALLRITVIRSAGPVFMTLVNYQVPLWSMAFGALVLAEALPLRFFAALGLILAGLVLSQHRALRRSLA